ncbi:hypothetical protein [Shouchella shacheensis]|uniref:hypothetical protein n=1 Tax=Shouchella shacheensis TaxID=1649580 RepID=UPI00073FC5CA|nr:hypothetical protein [Shouchella shacheensis]
MKERRRCNFCGEVISLWGVARSNWNRVKCPKCKEENKITAKTQRVSWILVVFYFISIIFINVFTESIPEGLGYLAPLLALFAVLYVANFEVEDKREGD